MSKRRFSEQNRDDYREPSLYRYRSEMVDADAVTKLFAETPFINGGLFDCLDDFKGVRAGGSRVDCFSDNPRHKTLLSIPNRLFFDENGLLSLFERYKFTVEENTPAEQEVALDPELLGSVFEHLLAAINPETRESARRQTGSYYTPRPVVDFMVDEALIATLTPKIDPAVGDIDFLEERIRYLLNYNAEYDDGASLFEEEEKQALVEAIAHMRILDPAAGSGAFPMGILQKLTLVLGRIDPFNHRWEAIQQEIAGQKAFEAFGILERRDRDANLQEISDLFERYRISDYGRKLYLIQNSIFGVDKQQIACQIAKLRFFISLAIEQSSNQHPLDNYGFRPLPNLEARFVAADTLMGLERPNQALLGSTQSVEEILQK